MHGWPPPHALPHVPQFSGSESRCAQASPQNAVPAGQTHLLDSHTCVVAHAFPHPPQFDPSAVVSTHDCEQAVYGGDWQVATHAPAWQSGVAPPHALPHAPQFIGSLATSVHAPLHTCFSAGQAHLPASHDCPLGHVVPHAPQLLASFVVSTHFEEQSVRPTAHGAWHAPFAHVSAASHVCPHDPQLCASFVRSRHCVPHGLCPLGHVIGGGGAQSPPDVHVSPAVQSELVEH
jgi:hypothetical protein